MARRRAEGLFKAMRREAPEAIRMAWDASAPAHLMAYLIPIIAWSIFWEGLGLWFAARNGDKAWFAFFLLFHLAGIPEIYYLRKRRCWPFSQRAMIGPGMVRGPS